MNARRPIRPGPARRAGGFTLIELMVAMLLSLIVVGVVLSILLGMLQGYRTNNALGDVQTSSRLAFELLARDIRSAGLTGCDGDGRVTNILKGSPDDTNNTPLWNADWNNALRGYTQGGATPDPALASLPADAPQQVPGTDSIQLIGADSTAMSVQSHALAAGQFTLNGATGNLQPGSAVIVCDPDHAALFQATAVSSGDAPSDGAAAASPTITYDTTANCGASLDYPGACGDGAGTYVFGANAQIAPLYAADWYIGVNPDGGKSLYRLAPFDPSNLGGDPPLPQEMVRGVTNMQLLYLQPNAPDALFATAAQVTSNSNNWGAVTAVQVTLTMQSAFQRAGTDDKPLQRQYTTTVTLYNRVH